jgi:hypothetical protein
MGRLKKYVPATIELDGLDQKVFMDFDRLIAFTVSAQMFRNEVDKYFETQLAPLIPNLYTEKFAQIADALDDLVSILQDEVSARSEQLGVEEGIRNVKPQYLPKKKKKRKKIKKQTRLHKTKI